MRLLLVLTSLLSHSFASATVSDGRIVGGHDITIEEAPYQISLQDNDAHSCGGSIISPSYIITAAHCTQGTTEDQLSVRAGTSIREDGGQVIEVKKIYNHPKYNTENGVPDYDIAILELSTNLELGFQVAVISLPSQNQEWPAGTDAFITGWGLLHEGDNTLPVNLQGATVQLTDENVCAESYSGLITERMFCAGVDGGGVDSCQSDSGGPLQVDGILAGIVSYGFDFINEITGLGGRW
ncbi:hypothetical protein Zmor_011360 [Zophobas morio]|uniref:Peptidase S1 domain-containing protein n=1 Tax=Zophobas morio TaxID=2755281 RepID=A0AA38IML7_9CUCU|nr:hypothetical protein Zmor_011360 [Zophobas morio]